MEKITHLKYGGKGMRQTITGKESSLIFAVARSVEGNHYEVVEMMM